MAKLSHPGQRRRARGRRYNREANRRSVTEPGAWSDHRDPANTGAGMVHEHLGGGMRASLADRVGLTTAGLDAITPRDVRSWVDRVRAGALDAGEKAATTRLVFRLWLVAFTLKALGSGWDVAWH